MADHERGIIRPDGHTTVQQLLDQLATKVLSNRTLSPSSQDNYNLALRVPSAQFGSDRIAKLDTARGERGLAKKGHRRQARRGSRLW